jgi:hypothetical protein
MTRIDVLRTDSPEDGPEDDNTVAAQIIKQIGGLTDQQAVDRVLAAAFDRSASLGDGRDVPRENRFEGYSRSPSVLAREVIRMVGIAGRIRQGLTHRPRRSGQ